MDFALTDDQRAIDEGVRRTTARFGDDYWLARDRDGAFPHEYRRAVADGGWLGIAMPAEHGGSGLGLAEAAVMMHAITDSAGAMSAASAVHLNIFGPMPIVVAGTGEQKARFLPPLIAGEEVCCFGVTEPDAGLDTGRIATFARREGPGYVVDGRKMWTSTAQVADRILLLARTTPREQCRRSTDGLTLFYTGLDRDRVEVREIPKMGRGSVDSNALFIDGLRVAEEDRIGEEGEGFRLLLHSLNPERVLVAVEAVGIGRQAVARAARYAKERVGVRPPHRAEPGRRAPSGAELDRARGGVAPGDARGLDVRQHPTRRRSRERGEVPRGRGRLPRLRARGDGARGHGLREGVPRRAPDARGVHPEDRAGEPGDDPQLHRRARARVAEVVLMAGDGASNRESGQNQS